MVELGKMVQSTAEHAFATAFRGLGKGAGRARARHGARAINGKCTEAGTRRHRHVGAGLTPLPLRSQLVQSRLK